MRSFSERNGYKPIQEVMQVESMNDDLRNSLWNVLQLQVWDSPGFMHAAHSAPGIDKFSKIFWALHFKKPVDSRPSLGFGVLDERGTLLFIRSHFFSSPWHEVYSIVEFILGYFTSNAQLRKHLSSVLETEMSGYRLVDDLLVPVTSPEEVYALKEAIEDSRFKGVSQHLSRALELLADRINPDYRNSIKESISAVEAIARQVTGNPSATLGDALKTLEKGGKLHASLSAGFSKLYGYTSDASGIRHAMLDEPELTQADAKYFLLSCTSFVNYLKASLP